MAKPISTAEAAADAAVCISLFTTNALAETLMGDPAGQATQVALRLVSIVDANLNSDKPNRCVTCEHTLDGNVEARMPAVVVLVRHQSVPEHSVEAVCRTCDVRYGAPGALEDAVVMRISHLMGLGCIYRQNGPVGHG